MIYRGLSLIALVVSVGISPAVADSMSGDMDSFQSSSASATTAPASKSDSNSAEAMSKILGMSTTNTPAVEGSGDIKNVRSQAVFEAAETYSAQTAYCLRAEKSKEWAQANQQTLDSVYDFSKLLMDGGRVLPPVIEQADSSYLQKGDDLAVTAQTTWNILRPAKIVSTAPDWRQYLMISCPKPLKPNRVLIPGSLEKTAKADEAQWQAGVKSGWKLGNEQAVSEFKLGMAKMTRDYQGMLRFYWLNQHGVVSAPILARGNVGIRVEGHTLNVGETVFRLTRNVDWNDQKKWSAQVTDK